MTPGQSRPEGPLGEGRHDHRDEIVVSAAFWLAAAAAVGLAVVYWRSGQPQLEGLLLATGAARLAVGMIVWAHRLLPQGPEAEERTGSAGTPSTSSSASALSSSAPAPGSPC